jgi:hypothetical protein
MRFSSQKFYNQTAVTRESTIPPTIKELADFLTQRCQTLESLHNKQSNVNSFLKSHKTSNFSSKISTTNRTYNPCIICNDHDHDTSYRRKNFLSLQLIKDYHKLKTQFTSELFKQRSHNCKMNFEKIQSVQR